MRLPYDPDAVCANPTCDMLSAPRRAGYCAACYQYRWRCGTDRPAYLTRPAERRCVNPVCAQPIAGQKHRYRRCLACHAYRWRTGRERPLVLALPRTWRCAACGTAKRGKYHQTCNTCYRRAARQRQREQQMERAS